MTELVGVCRTATQAVNWGNCIGSQGDNGNFPCIDVSSASFEILVKGGADVRVEEAVQYGGGWMLSVHRWGDSALFLGRG